MAFRKLLLKQAESFKTTMHRPRIKGKSEDKKQRPLVSKNQSCHTLELTVLKCLVSKQWEQLGLL